MEVEERSYEDDRGVPASSRLRRESHDLPELSQKRRGSFVGVGVFCLLMCAYFLILVGAVLSLGFFAWIQNQISSRVHGDDNSSSGACILFAGHNNTDVLFPDSPLCPAVIYGLASVAILAFLMCLGSCLRSGLNLLRRISP